MNDQGQALLNMRAAADLLAPPPGVRILISAERIASSCSRCGAQGMWPRADVEFAAERLRCHPAECEVGA